MRNSLKTEVPIQCLLVTTCFTDVLSITRSNGGELKESGILDNSILNRTYLYLYFKRLIVGTLLYCKPLYLVSLPVMESKLCTLLIIDSIIQEWLLLYYNTILLLLSANFNALHLSVYSIINTNTIMSHNVQR